MSAIQINVKPNTPEWHAWRMGGVGASDVAAILGKSPYKTQRDLFCEKMGMGSADDEDKSYIFQRGHETEELVRNLFQDQTGIEMNPVCFQLEDIWRASLDGWNKSLGVMESKLVGAKVLQKAKKDHEIPEHHRIQIQAQLKTSESDKAFWCGHDGKKTGIAIEIGRDESLINEITEKGLRFWEYLEEGKMPPLSERDILFITDPNQKALFQKLIELRTQKTALEAAYSEIETQIKALANHPKVRCEGITVTTVERRGSIDYAKVPEVKGLSEEYLDQFRKKASVYKQIRFGGE